MTIIIVYIYRQVSVTYGHDKQINSRYPQIEWVVVAINHDSDPITL